MSPQTLFPTALNELSQGELYAHAAAEYGAALDRLARGYERDTERRRDLLQEIHLELWRSFAAYEFRASLRTWLYRIAHNVAAKHIWREQRSRPAQMLDLEAAAQTPTVDDEAAGVEEGQILERLLAEIHRLLPLDRQVMLLYLDELDAATIGDITGLSPGAVATKIHRIKTLLARRLSVKE